MKTMLIDRFGGTDELYWKCRAGPLPMLAQVAAFRQRLAAVDARAIKIPPYEVMSIKDVAKAQDKVEDGHVRGKIILSIAGFQDTGI